MDTITVTNAQGRSVSVGYDRENGRSVGYAVRDSAGAPIFEQSFARDGWRPWLVTNATAGGAGVSQSTMKRTVFGIFLALNLPVFADIDLPNQSKIPLRGSLGLNHEDAGKGRLSCSLANETDRDWLVCVDESGVIVPKSVPEDARPSDIVEWTEIETFPNVFQRDGWHLEAVSNRIP